MPIYRTNVEKAYAEELAKYSQAAEKRGSQNTKMKGTKAKFLRKILRYIQRAN